MNNEQTLQIALPPPCFIHSVGNCPPIRFFNCDNLEFMKSVPDKYYDLAIVDPPYGIGEDGSKNGKRGSGKWKGKDYKPFAGNDKSIPPPEYFEQLFRVSKNQVIWGGNYMVEYLKPTMGWIFWNKNRAECDFSDGEIAYTSFQRATKLFTYTWDGFRQGKTNQIIEQRFHPTQKPRALYQWILQKYATKGDKILDTHGGSMSIAQACEIEGFALDIMEIDPDYFMAGLNAFKMHIRQARLF